MSASKSSIANTRKIDIPVWNLMTDCWQGYTAGALESMQNGHYVPFGSGRIHIHWGIVWGSRPVLFHLENRTSALGSNDWTPTGYNFARVDSCPPLEELDMNQQYKAVAGLTELYDMQLDLIEANLDSGDWLSESYTLRDGTTTNKVCSAHKITRTLAHLLETNKLDSSRVLS